MRPWPSGKSGVTPFAWNQRQPKSRDIHWPREFTRELTPGRALLRTWAEQFEESWVGDTDVVDQATHDGFENLRLVFDRRFLETFMGRMDENEAIDKRIHNDKESRTPLMGSHANRLYNRLRGLNSGTAS